VDSENYAKGCATIEEAVSDFEGAWESDLDDNEDEVRMNKIMNDHILTQEEIADLLTIVGYVGNTRAHKMARNGLCFSIGQLQQLGQYSETIAITMYKSRNVIFTVDDLIILIKTSNNDRAYFTLATIMAENHHVFSVDDILRFNEALSKCGGAIAENMAHHGHKFSVDDLIRIGDDEGRISHIMAHKEHQFSTEEIIRLGNPKLSDIPLSCELADMGRVFSVYDLIKFNSDFGDTNQTAVAMIEKGHKFSVDDILLLGNQYSMLYSSMFVGMSFTLDAEMERKGHKFSEKEKERLNNCTEAERDALLLTLFQDEACRQAVDAGQAPPVEILMARPDLLMEYGGVV
jgi:hypothetical protein